LSQFFWIDFAGIHQDDQWLKRAGISKLPLFAACCSETILFNSPSYEGRAWTRLERCIGTIFNIMPLFVYMDSTYVDTKEPLDNARLAATNAGFHICADSGSLCIQASDPLAAAMTDKRDKAEIEKLLQVLGKLPSAKLSERSTLVTQPHGVTGVLDFDNSARIGLDTAHWNLDLQRMQTATGGTD